MNSYSGSLFNLHQCSINNIYTYIFQKYLVNSYKSFVALMNDLEALKKAAQNGHSSRPVQQILNSGDNNIN